MGRVHCGQDLRSRKIVPSWDLACSLCYSTWGSRQVFAHWWLLLDCLRNPPPTHTRNINVSFSIKREHMLYILIIVKLLIGRLQNDKKTDKIHQPLDGINLVSYDIGSRFQILDMNQNRFYEMRIILIIMIWLEMRSHLICVYQVLQLANPSSSNIETQNI